MSADLKTTTRHHTTRIAVKQLLLGLFLITALGACSTQGVREAELAAAEQAAMEQEAARVAREAREQERQLVLERERQQRAEAAERARLQAQREAEEEAASMRADAERRQREAAERREAARLAALAATQAERQAKLDRIAELEAQIATLQASTTQDENATAVLNEAILVAEELLGVLTAEQAKYEATDATGNTVEPLAKDLIAELEAQKDNLVRRAAQ